MRISILAFMVAAAAASGACSNVDTSDQGAVVSDTGLRFSKTPITMTTASGVAIKMSYGIAHFNYSSNKPDYRWYISPLEFEVKGLAPESQARVVFTNIADVEGFCWSGRYEKKTTYFVDLSHRDGLFVGNLSQDGFFIGDDGKNYKATVYPPYTRLHPYCTSEQSKKQLVAVVVDGVWQTARFIERDGVRTEVAGNLHDFDLHMESY